MGRIQQKFFNMKPGKMMEFARAYGNSPYGQNLKAVAEGKVVY